MKGIVFTEFLEMVEDKFGYALVDQLLMESSLPSGGIYTAVGTYDHAEMTNLVHRLSIHTHTPIPDLLQAYGRYMFATFTRSYKPLVDRADSAFSLLSSIQDYIHVEVRKLYPDAELPHFTIHRESEDRLIMRYESERKLADFAHGLIEGCLAYFGETATIAQTKVTDDGQTVVFEITRS